MEYQLKDSSNSRQIIREGTINRTYLNAPPVLVCGALFYWRSNASTEKCMIYCQGGGEFLNNIEIQPEKNYDL